MIGAAILMVLVFFVVKGAAGYFGGTGYALSPAVAAWIPLLVFGPIAYTRYRDVHLV